MHTRAVIALVVILEHHLPVRGDLVGDALDAAQIRERIVREPRRRLTNLLRERVAASVGLARREIQKKEAAPRVDANGIERELILAHACALVEIRSRAQRAIERIRPRVIRALDPAAERARELWRASRAVRSREHELTAPVSTHVIVGAQCILARTHHEHALARDVHHEIAPRRSDIFLAPRMEPLTREDALLLAREQLRREVVLAGERALHAL